MRMSRRIASFLTLSSSKIEEVSLNCCVFDVVKFKNWGNLRGTRMFLTRHLLYLLNRVRFGLAYASALRVFIQKRNWIVDKMLRKPLLNYQATGILHKGTPGNPWGSLERKALKGDTCQQPQKGWTYDFYAPNPMPRRALPAHTLRCDFHGPGVSCNAEGIILYMSNSAFGPRFSAAWSVHILERNVLTALFFKQLDAVRSSIMSAEASGCSCHATKRAFCGAKPRCRDFTLSDFVMACHV